jgi:hypothetical protein
MKRVFIFLSLFLFLTPEFLFAAGKVEIVTVQTESKNKIRQVAINDALLQAVKKVNGINIASQTETVLGEIGGNGNYDLGALKSKSFDGNLSVGAYAELISSKTNGMIKTWRIISESKDGGIYFVKLSVDIAKYTASKESKRLRLAIIPFRISKNVQDIKSAQAFEMSLGIELENYLTQSGRFAILDRTYLLEQSNELTFINEGGSNPDELTKLGNRLGTDYLVIGTVDKSSNSKIERKSKVSNKVVSSSSASAKVTFRIIDVPTSQIKFADTYMINDNDSDASALSMAKKIGSSIIEAIYPIRILSANSDGLILGQGGSTVSIGQKFSVLQLGKILKDPYTNEDIGREELEVATIEITKILPAMSNAKIIESKVDLSKIAGVDKLIIRPNLLNNQTEKDKKQTLPKKDKSIEKLEKESEKEW